MFSPATVAALAPFILGITQASVVRASLFPSLLLPNYPVPPPSDPASHFKQAQQVPRTDVSPVSDVSQAAMAILGGDATYQCNTWNDWDCYHKYWDHYRYCHPYDQHCYRDCDNYDDYWDHCKSYDKDYGQCFDRCYYDDENCGKYKECHDDEDDCYRKKRREDHCDPHDRDNKCRDKHEYPKDFCKPWDWECHQRKHQDHDYHCHPGKDKDCYPDYPDYPDYDDDEHHPDPKHNVVVQLYGDEGAYDMSIWPDGEEHYTGKSIPTPNLLLPCPYTGFKLHCCALALLRPR